MGRSVLVSVTALIGLTIVIGAFLHLSQAHGNTDSFVSFLTVVIPLGIPAYIAMVKSNQAHAKVSEVSDKVETAAADAATAAEASQQAENNTNGKMAIQFEQVRAMLTEVDHKISQHLIDHNSGGS